MCALTVGAEKGIWTYLDEHDDPFKAAEVVNVNNIDPPMLCMFPSTLTSLKLT